MNDLERGDGEVATMSINVGNERQGAELAWLEADATDSPSVVHAVCMEAPWKSLAGWHQ